MRVPKKCMLEPCPWWHWERAVTLPRVQAAALLHGSRTAVPGSVPQTAGRGAVLRAAGALPGSDPAVFSLQHVAAQVHTQWDELMEERGARTCKVVCAFIIEFP